MKAGNASPESPSAKVLLQWIREGMAYQHEGEATLERVTVEPAAGVYRRAAQQTLSVTAHYSDGQQRNVTALADFVSNDNGIATVTDAGRVTVGGINGEGTIVARYMGQVAISRVTVPAEKKIAAAKYAALPAHNFIDELAYAQFQRLSFCPASCVRIRNSCAAPRWTPSVACRLWRRPARFWMIRRRISARK